jgi:hypothetical protein
MKTTGQKINPEVTPADWKPARGVAKALAKLLLVSRSSASAGPNESARPTWNTEAFTRQCDRLARRFVRLWRPPASWVIWWGSKPKKK